MAQLITLTDQPIRVTAPGRQQIFLALDVERFDSLDLALVCNVEGTASGATVKLYTGMQIDTEDGWEPLADNFANISGSGPQSTRATIGKGLLKYLRWDVGSLGGATSITFFVRGIGRSARVLGSGGEAIVWGPGKSWAEVYQEIQAQNGRAVVLVDFVEAGEIACLITPGDYNINEVQFCSPSWAGAIDVQDGAHFVADSNNEVNLSLFGIALFTYGAVTTSGASLVWRMDRSQIIHSSTTSPAFPGIVGSLIVASGMQTDSPLWDISGTQPVATVAAATSLTCYLQGNLNFGSGTIGGSGEVILGCDPVGRYNTPTDILTGGATYATGSPYVYPIVLCDSAGTGHGPAGTLGRNSTTGALQMSDGSAWNDVGGGTGTLAASYAAGSSSSDQTLVIQASDGDQPILSVAGVGTAQTPGLTLKNPTAATLDNQKFSPMVELIGQGWKTAATAASQTVKLGLQARPIQGSANPDVVLDVYRSINGAAYDRYGLLFCDPNGVGGPSGGVALGGRTFTLSAGYCVWADDSQCGLHDAQGARSIIFRGYGLYPYSSGDPINIGDPNYKFAEAWAVRSAGTEQTIAAAATITLNPANGESIRITLGATSITTVNASSGYPGEHMTVQVIQDATGGRSISGWSASFKLAGGSYTPTATANKRDVLTFVWDNTNSVWVEQARSMNL